MKNIIPNDEYIKELSEDINVFIKHLQKEVELMMDTEGDLFDRFTSAHNLAITFQYNKFMSKLQRQSMSAGHLLSHESLHTDAAKANEWDVASLTDHPFFIDADENEEKPELEDILEMLNTMKKLIK